MVTNSGLAGKGLSDTNSACSKLTTCAKTIILA